ncbi:hypothetical protein NDU88_000713, partial [Pleurodeles waltl]
ACLFASSSLSSLSLRLQQSPLLSVACLSASSSPLCSQEPVSPPPAVPSALRSLSLRLQ